MTLQLNMQSANLSEAEIGRLAEMRKNCARKILLSTTLAGSGHPGGSLSSLDMLLVAYGCIKHDPADPRMESRDRVIASIGHISPAVYAVLSEYGYFSEKDFLGGFRRTGSGFPGHVESIVPGVEWDTGNLGQGLSTAVGIAHGLKIRGASQKVVVFMGDGEHQKGQISEAIRHARKYKLDNLIVLVDRNHLQICGSTDEVMGQSIRDLYATNGWRTEYLEDGHDVNGFFDLFSKLYTEPTGQPAVIVARTTMGKGISFMENLAKYHGSPLKREQLQEALTELGVEEDMDVWDRLRSRAVSTDTIVKPVDSDPEVKSGEVIVYEKESKTDNRSAYGNALLSLAKANHTDSRSVLVGISCDLEGSVKMGGFRKHSPMAFVETGIQEHHAATMAGGVSRVGLVPFFSTFGSFAVSEVYNQNRLNDFNHTNVKVVATHVGLDVGEDGPTHQCIDYLGLMRNYYRFSVYMPADPNQCDRMIRCAATHVGNVFIGMGRSKMSMILNEDGEVFFDAGYRFRPGRADWLRRGEQATIITYGSLAGPCVAAWKILAEQGKKVSVLNMGSITPLDTEAILQAADQGPVITVEDHHVDSGLGAMVAIVLLEGRKTVSFKRLGVTRYGGSGKPSELYARQGLDARSIADSVLELI